MTIYISEAELGIAIKRIMREEVNKNKYNCDNINGLTLEQITEKVAEKYGDDWDVDETEVDA